MNFNKILTSLFGNKSTRDMKLVKPLVEKVKQAYPEIEKLDNDALRAKTKEIQSYVQDSAKDEKAMLERRRNGVNPMESVAPICDVNMLQKMQAEVNNVFVHEKVVDYIIALINRTRGHGDLMRGASPRATIALTAMAKSHAYLSGRNYVVPQDVQRVFLPVITHRLILTPEAEVNGRKTSDIAKEILESAFVPKV